VSAPAQIPDESQKLAEVSSEVSAVVAHARELEVTTEAQAQQATGVLLDIKVARYRSERARRFLVDPLNAHVKAINARMKSAVVPLDEADGLVRGKLLAFRQLQEREREREQARLDAERKAAEEQAAAERRRAWEEAQRAEREAEEAALPREVLSELSDEQLVEFANGGGKREQAAWLELEARRKRREAEEATQRSLAAQAAPAPTVAAPAPLAADSGSASVRREWKATVIDPSELPREYTIPDVKGINAAVRAGVRDIPGCKIELVEGLAVRAHG
jgi:hypothetical protein